MTKKTIPAAILMMVCAFFTLQAAEGLLAENNASAVELVKSLPLSAPRLIKVWEKYSLSDSAQFVCVKFGSNGRETQFAFTASTTGWYDFDGDEEQFDFASLRAVYAVDLDGNSATGKQPSRYGVAGKYDVGAEIEVRMDRGIYTVVRTQDNTEIPASFVASGQTLTVTLSNSDLPPQSPVMAGLLVIQGGIRNIAVPNEAELSQIDRITLRGMLLTRGFKVAVKGNDEKGADKGKISLEETVQQVPATLLRSPRVSATYYFVGRNLYYVQAPPQTSPLDGWPREFGVQWDMPLLPKGTTLVAVTDYGAFVAPVN